MFGLNLETSSISLLVLATTIECIRLTLVTLLTLAHMGLNILNTPYQNVLPLWTPQQNNPNEEANGQRNFTGQACSAGGDYVWTPQQNNPNEEANGQRHFTGQACRAGGDYIQIN